MGRHKNTEWARSHRHHHHHRCRPPTNSYVKYQLLKALALMHIYPFFGYFSLVFFLLQLVDGARWGNKDVDARH